MDIFGPGDVFNASYEVLLAVVCELPTVLVNPTGGTVEGVEESNPIDRCIRLRRIVGLGGAESVTELRRATTRVSRA